MKQYLGAMTGGDGADLQSQGGLTVLSAAEHALT